jgi:methionine-gamma-lyase
MSQPRRRRRPHPGPSTRDRRSIRPPEPSAVPIYQTSTFAFESTNAGRGAVRRRGGRLHLHPPRQPHDRGPSRTASPKLEGGYRGLATASGMAAGDARSTSPLLGQGRPRRLLAAPSTARAGPSSSTHVLPLRRRRRPSSHTETGRGRSRRPCGPRRASSTSRRRPTRPSRSPTSPAPPRSAHAARRPPLRRQHLLQPRASSGRSSTAADIVLHSMTKFLNGHADVVAGHPRGEGTRPTFARLRPVVVTSVGGTIDPHQAWLVLRGLKTLPLRVDRGPSRTPRRSPRMLEAHPTRSEWVRYPGLAEPPRPRAGSSARWTGPARCISFELQGGFGAGQHAPRLACG